MPDPAVSDPCVVSPAALTSLTQLRELFWDTRLQPDAALPPGAWPPLLQSAAIPWWLLRTSLPAASGTGQLQTLAVLDDELDAEACCAILRWAAERPGLRHLILEGGGVQVDNAAVSALMDAARRNPRLTVEFRPISPNFLPFLLHWAD